MAGAQQQHPAQGPSTLNPSPTQAQASNTQPILTHIDPAHDLERYRTLCSVDSVYYDPAGSCCAVVLKVGFDVPFAQGALFKYALFPTRVPGIKLFHYPDRDEMFKMSERTVNKNLTFTPNVQAGGVGGSFGSLSRQEARTLYGILHLRPQTACHDEIQWQFVNQKGDYFPSSVKLLLLVKGRGSPRFPFELKVLPTLEVHVRMKRWHIWTTRMKPKVCHGWSCQIESDYYPDTARKFALEYEKPQEERKRSQMVGLHGAMVSYLDEFRR
ncbi:hypothetical protein M405DRAFT_882055 [Rhizopogon salebrosus TDB-379]|nr:hypothetical protein M405DRAFT_882055 [Rhizopogon salebrosus TDB-379]